MWISILRIRPEMDNQMTWMDVLRMIKRRTLAAGIDANRICCHTFRATGITEYLRKRRQA